VQCGCLLFLNDIKTPTQFLTIPTRSRARSELDARARSDHCSGAIAPEAKNKQRSKRKRRQEKANESGHSQRAASYWYTEKQQEKEEIQLTKKKNRSDCRIS